MTLDDLIARLPADACVTVSKIGHRWSAGLRSRANGPWAFSGASTPGEALRKVLADLPGEPGAPNEADLAAAQVRNEAHRAAIGAPEAMIDGFGDEDLIG